MQSAIKTGRPRNQAKSTHSRSYPRGVGIDFRKLAGLTLMSYIDHHGASRTRFYRKITASNYIRLLDFRSRVCASVYHWRISSI